MTMKLRGNGEKDNHATTCCSHLPATSKAARTQAAGNSCHPIKLNNLQVLGGSTCVQLAEQIHLLRDAGPPWLLQFGCALLALPGGGLPSSSRRGAGVRMLCELGKPCSAPGSCKGFYRCMGKYKGLSSLCSCSLPMEGTGAVHWACRKNTVPAAGQKTCFPSGLHPQSLPSHHLFPCLL